MPKVLVDLLADFGPKKDKVVSVGRPVEAAAEAILAVAKSKLELKKKDLEAGLRLYARDLTGVLTELPPGPCADLLQNGFTVLVSSKDLLGEAAPPSAVEGSEMPSASVAPMLTKKMKAAQQAASELEWVPAGRGHVAARGCPNLETLAFLQRDRGLTGLVTLLRASERECAADQLQAACRRLKPPLRWLHAPLEGVESLTGGAESMLEGDLESFRTVLQVAEWLQGAEERIIVHCSAGLHRTGVYLYVLLRVLGDTPEEALEKLGASREQTFEEFARLDFWSQAESIVRVVTGSEA